MSKQFRGAFLLIGLFIAVGVAGTVMYPRKSPVNHHGRGRIIDENGNEREMTKEDWDEFNLTEEQFRRLQDEMRKRRGGG